MARPTAGGSGTKTTLPPLPHRKDTVTVFYTQVANAGAGGFEDPQAQQPEHGYQREVISVRGLARGGQQDRQCLAPVDHARPVEPGGHGESPRHRGRLEPAELLHPQDAQFQIRAAGGQRIKAAPRTPGEITTQAGLSVLTGRA